MSIRDLARPEIRALEPYHAATQVADTVRLNANEAPWSSAVGAYRRPLNRYPEIRPAALQRALAAHYGCAPEQLLVTRGSSEAIDLLIRVFCRTGVDGVLTMAPSFAMYGHYAAVQGARFREIPGDPRKDFAVLGRDLIAACDESTRAIFICSPNNPTGTLYPRDALLEVLDAKRARAAVIIDEAYIEFAGVPSAVELLHEFPNLIVLRTLSKALALAGARCGAVIAAPEIIDLLNAVQAPYALATPVVEIVESALENATLEKAQRRIREIVAERERMRIALAEFSCVERVWPSSANFLLLQVADPQGLVETARKNGVLLRYFGGNLKHCVRVTVGSRSENDRVLDVLRCLEGAQ